ncbi:MAG TPA: ABC transporter permease [Gaiellaceae bacterium]|nr:ABC transporter permease [Gaiellaceae bacterium]
MSTELGAKPSPGWTPRTSTARVYGAATEFFRRAGILTPFLVLFIVLSLTSKPFATRANLLNILDQQSATLIIAAAGTLVLVAGGIDLSVGAVYGFAAVTSAHFALHWNPAVAMLIGIGSGLLIGLANGAIITLFRINSLIATLAMSFIIAGASGLVTNGNLLVLFDKPAFGDLARPHFLTIKTSTWLMLLAVILIGLLLATTTAGRYMYATGGNAEAARLAGVRVDATRILTFAISGTAAGLAGVLDTSNVLSAQATSNDTLTFTVLAGIVVGGTSILGGEGAVWRTFVGVLFIALVDNGYLLLQFDPLYEQITLGVLLLAAVALDALSRGLFRPGAAIKQLVERRRSKPLDSTRQEH